MVTRVSFDQSSGSFIDHEDIAFNTSTPTVEHPSTPSSRVIEGAIAVNGSAGEVRTVAYGRHSEPITGTAGASVASTLQARYGPTASVELVPGNPASRTSVEVAANMGLIRRDEAGNWVDVAPAEQQAASLEKQLNPEQPQQQEEQGGDEVFDREAYLAYADAIAPLPQTAVDVAQAHAVAGIFEGQSLSQVTAEVGQRLARDSGLGLEPSQAAEVVRHGVQYFEGAVARVAALEGVDATMKEAFYESLRQGNQAGLRDALSKLVYQGDASGFRELARAYAVATPSPTVKALEAAGWQVARTDEGWVTRPQHSTGGWVPLAELVQHAAAGAPAAPAPVPPAKAPTKAPGGRTKLYFNPATLECDLTEAEAVRDGVDLSRFVWK